MATEGIKLTLNCLVEGQIAAITISTHVDATVNQLRQDIYRQVLHEVRSVGNIFLWKVDVDTAVLRDPNFQFKIENYQNDPLHSPNDSLSVLWRKQPSLQHFHIFARVTGHENDVVGHKRHRLDDSGAAGASREQLQKQNEELQKQISHLIEQQNEGARPWLKELYELIWDRSHLEEKLFQEVEVTQAHYDALQTRLNMIYPDRRLPQYDGAGQDVLKYKLEILESTNLAAYLLSRPPDDNMDQVDDGDVTNANEDLDDSDLNEFFPFTLKYLDLSSLGLKNNSARFQLPLLCRQEYEHISTLIKRRPQKAYNSFIVSGQPGTGKTSYIYLRIIQSLIAGTPFLYQSKEGVVHHVSQDGVNVIKSPLSQTDDIVAFVDGDGERSEPNWILFAPFIQIIVASFPKGANQPWVKQTSTHAHMNILATSLWSPAELFLTGIFLHPHDITFPLIRKATRYFGYNPRQCFAASCSKRRLKANKAQLTAQIKDLSDTRKILQELHSVQSGRSLLSHEIFHIYPDPEDDSRLLAECKFGTTSRWVLDRLMKACVQDQADPAAAFYHLLENDPRAESLRGHLFEWRVLTSADTRVDPPQPNNVDLWWSH